MEAIITNAPALGPEELRRMLAAAAAGARGLVLAIGAGGYLDTPGTVAVLVADEQRKFNGDRASYLYLSPMVRQATGTGLAPDGPAPFFFAVTLDGAERGVASLGSLVLALGSLASGPLAAQPRLLAVHALAGHRPEAIAALATALSPRHAFFWVHDFSAACGNATLLRNDREYCHAPQPTCTACRVCAHGPARPAHLARVRALFAAVNFVVVAPSAPALALFRAATDLPAAGHLVHPHLQLGAADGPNEPATDGPARIAFAGPATIANGFFRFAMLVARTDDAAMFFQFAAPGEQPQLPGVTLVEAAATGTKPFALVYALAEHRIDFLVALAPSPEVFPAAALAARAAGAGVLATAGTLPGDDGTIVLPDDAALAEFLRDGSAEACARERRPHRRAAPLLHSGSTATIALAPGIAPTTDAPDVHLLLRGARLDGQRIGDTVRFALPPPDPAEPRRIVRLRSRSLRGAWDRAVEGERRRLGVAVTSLALDGADVPPGDPRRVGGWHKPDAEWQWTDGDAGLVVGAARQLDVTIRPLGRYWCAPLLTAP
jgi:hypothetical protein